MPEEKKRFAAVITLTSKGEYILQLRDDTPAIADPGKLSLFAGRMHTDESPLQAAIRELEEETTLRRADLTFYKSFEKDPARHGAPGTCHVYVARDVDPLQVHIHEGQGYRIISDVSELNEDNTAVISLDIIQQYALDGEPA